MHSRTKNESKKTGGAGHGQLPSSPQQKGGKVAEQVMDVLREVGWLPETGWGSVLICVERNQYCRHEVKAIYKKYM